MAWDEVDREGGEVLVECVEKSGGRCACLVSGWLHWSSRVESDG